MLIVEVAPRSRKPTCPRCGWRARGRFEIKTRQWRHVAIGGMRTVLEGPIRRLRCHRCQRVVTEQVPWSRHGSRFTRTFEDVATYLAQNLPKTKVAQLLDIAWETVGSIAGRLVVNRPGFPGDPNP